MNSNRCTGITMKGLRCKKNKLKDCEYCTVHKAMNIVPDTCSICMETPQKISTQVLTNCKHAFCKSCINEWFCNDNKCPNCRDVISDSDEFIFSKYSLKNKLYVFVVFSTISFENVTNEEYLTFM